MSVTFVYEFKHPRMGFTNEITINNANDEKHAIERAEKELKRVYGEKLFKRFKLAKRE